MKLNSWTGGWVGVVALSMGFVVLGCGKRERVATTAAGSGAEDSKGEIFSYLSQKSGVKVFATGIDLELPERVARLRAEATGLEQQLVAMRTKRRELESKRSAVETEFEVLRQKVLQAKREAAEARKALEEARGRVPTDPREIETRAADRRTKDAAWEEGRAALKASEPLVEAERAARRDHSAALERELDGLERKWEVARGEASRAEQALSNQEDDYIDQVREQMGTVRSYEALYRLVGEQLATADRLMAETNMARRRVGLKLAREACGHVSSGDVDVWLAARICQAYFWPNLDLADAGSKPGSHEGSLELLETARRVLFGTDETNAVQRNYALQMERAPNEQAADRFRVQLADWLEEKGALREAAAVLAEVTDGEVLASAKERITRVSAAVGQ